jgi:hypothetical protein
LLERVTLKRPANKKYATRKSSVRKHRKKYKPEFDKLQKDGDDLLKRSENAKIIPAFDVKVK